LTEIEAEMYRMSYQTVNQVNKVLDEYINQVDTISLVPYSDTNMESYLAYVSGIKEYFYDYRLSTGGIRIKNKQALMPDTGKIDNTMQNFVNAKQNIDFTSLIALNGDMLTKSRFGIVKPQYDFLKDDRYEELLVSKGEKVITPVHITEYLFAPKTEVFSVGRKIFSFDIGTYIGYILIDCNTDVFKRILNDVKIGKTGFILIINIRGELFFNSGVNQSEERLKSIIASVLEKKEPSKIRDTGTGKNMLVSGTSSFTGWTVIGVLPYADIINRVQGIKFTFFLLAVIFVILVSVSSVLISRSVTKPMRDLQNAMKKVENGNTDIRVSIHNYNEVGALSHSFNQLIERINILLASIKKIEVRKREAEMDALNSQINPHFLYNTLESIRMMAVIEEKKEIAAATEALADLFRYSIKHRKDLVDIKDEIQHAVNFIRLLKIRYEDKFDFVVDMDNDIYQYKALKFILQPILENAIYHGIIKKPGKGVVKLSVHIEENNVVFNIWDDGIGMDAQKLCELREYLENVDMEDMKSIGLKNVNDRVRLYFGNSYGIAIDSSQGQWTRVKLAIPAFSNEEWVVNNVFGISCR